MCVCRPEVRTPWCGGPGCKAPMTDPAPKETGRERVFREAVISLAKAGEAIVRQCFIYRKGDIRLIETICAWDDLIERLKTELVADALAALDAHDAKEPRAGKEK